jgi:hypothetical protein
METMNISIAKDFCETPAGRYVDDGPFSGQRFRNEVLVPALQAGKAIQINFDGTLGYGSSFLEEAFGGLIRAGFKVEDLKARLQIVSSLKAYRDRVWRYIEEAALRSARA